jgi:hypothetical protein
MRTAFWVITQPVVVIFIDVSGQFIGPIFKDQDGTDKFEDRTGKLYRNVDKILPLLAA